MARTPAEARTIRLRSRAFATTPNTPNEQAQALLEDGTPEQALATAQAWLAIASSDETKDVPGAAGAVAFWSDVAALLRLETQSDETSEEADLRTHTEGFQAAYGILVLVDWMEGWDTEDEDQLTTKGKWRNYFTGARIDLG